MYKRKICLGAAIFWCISTVVWTVLAVTNYGSVTVDKVTVFLYAVCAVSSLLFAFVDFLRYWVYRKLDRDGHL